MEEVIVDSVSQVMISETLEWDLTVDGKSHTLRIHESDYEGRTIWWDNDEWDQDEDLENITADEIWQVVESAESFRYDDLKSRYQN
jgi:hypothetical protein